MNKVIRELRQGIRSLYFQLFLLSLALLILAYSASAQEPSYICWGECGDVNGDNITNFQDKEIIKDYVLGYGLLPVNATYACADVDGNYFINIADVSLLENEYPLNCKDIYDYYPQNITNITVLNVTNVTNITNVTHIYERNITTQQDCPVVDCGSSNTRPVPKQAFSYCNEEHVEADTRIVYKEKVVKVNQTCEPEVIYKEVVVDSEKEPPELVEVKEKPSFWWLILGILLIGAVIYVAWKRLKPKTELDKFKEEIN